MPVLVFNLVFIAPNYKKKHIMICNITKLKRAISEINQALINLGGSINSYLKNGALP
jgi:hypothetical protein